MILGLKLLRSSELVGECRGGREQGFRLTPATSFGVTFIKAAHPKSQALVISTSKRAHLGSVLSFLWEGGQGNSLGKLPFLGHILPVLPVPSGQPPSSQPARLPRTPALPSLVSFPDELKGVTLTGKRKKMIKDQGVIIT